MPLNRCNIRGIHDRDQLKFPHADCYTCNSMWNWRCGLGSKCLLNMRSSFQTSLQDMRKYTRHMQIACSQNWTNIRLSTSLHMRVRSIVLRIKHFRYRFFLLYQIRPRTTSSCSIMLLLLKPCIALIMLLWLLCLSNWSRAVWWTDPIRALSIFVETTTAFWYSRGWECVGGVPVASTSSSFWCTWCQKIAWRIPVSSTARWLSRTATSTSKCRSSLVQICRDRHGEGLVLGL